MFHYLKNNQIYTIVRRCTVVYIIAIRCLPLINPTMIFNNLVSLKKVYILEKWTSTRDAEAMPSLLTHHLVRQMTLAKKVLSKLLLTLDSET